MSSKVVWLPQLNPQQYLHMLSLGSMMVDPFPFGGGVTSLEGISLCVPVVTAPALQSVPGLTAGIIETINAAITRNPNPNSAADEESLFSLLVAQTDEPLELITLAHRLLQDDVLLNRTSSRICEAFKLHDRYPNPNPQQQLVQAEEQAEEQEPRVGDEVVYSVAGVYNNRQSILDWADFITRSNQMATI